MYRKIALVLVAATVSIPVGAAVAGSPAFAATRTRSASVVKMHKESPNASKDASESSSTDRSKDIHRENSSLDTSKDRSSKDTTKDASNVDTSPTADHSAG